MVSALDKILYKENNKIGLMIKLTRFLVEQDMAKSMSDARRLIQQGAVKWNDKKLTNFKTIRIKSLVSFCDHFLFKIDF